MEPCKNIYNLESGLPGGRALLGVRGLLGYYCDWSTFFGTISLGKGLVFLSLEKELISPLIFLVFSIWGLVSNFGTTFSKFPNGLGLVEVCYISSFLPKNWLAKLEGLIWIGS